MELSGPVLRYIQDVLIGRLKTASDTEGLVDLATFLEDEILTNKAISVSPRGHNTSTFRDEVACVLAIVNDIIYTWDDPLPPYDLRFDQTVLDKTGSDMEETDYSIQCTRGVLQQEADAIRQLPANAEVYKLMCGRHIASLAYARVTLYDHIVQLPTDEPAVYERLEFILGSLAHACIWNNTKDIYFHDSLKPKLCAERLALMAANESPLRQMPRQYPGKAANDLGSRYLDVTAGDRERNIDWAISGRIDDFVFAISILRELYVTPTPPHHHHRAPLLTTPSHSISPVPTAASRPTACASTSGPNCRVQNGTGIVNRRSCREISCRGLKGLA
jgi:hypothetical protein